MQINKVMSLLDILTSWLEDNINMESDLFFDNDVDNTALLQIVGGDKLIIPFC